MSAKRKAMLKALRAPRVDVEALPVEDMQRDDGGGDLEAPVRLPEDYPEADVRSQYMQALRQQWEAEAAKRRAAMHAAPSGWAQAVLEALSQVGGKYGPVSARGGR